MNIPKKVKQGGNIYKIVVGEVYNGCCGQCDTQHSTIYINSDMDDRQKEVTLLHELLHSINIIMPEETVEYLAQAWYQLIVDNPTMFERNKDEK